MATLLTNIPELEESFRFVGIWIEDDPLKRYSWLVLVKIVKRERDKLRVHRVSCYLSVEPDGVIHLPAIHRPYIHRDFNEKENHQVGNVTSLPLAIGRHKEMSQRRWWETQSKNSSATATSSPGGRPIPLEPFRSTTLSSSPHFCFFVSFSFSVFLILFLHFPGCCFG